MQWFFNLSIRIKLLSLVGLLIGLMSIIALQGLSSTAKINEMTDNLYERELLGLSYVKEANIAMLHQARAVRSYLCSGKVKLAT